MTRVVIALPTLMGLAIAQDGRQPAPPAPKDFAVMARGGSPSDPNLGGPNSVRSGWRSCAGYS